MKKFLSFLLLACTAALAAQTPDAKKFFGAGPVPADVKLPADLVYPQGRLFPFSFYSTGGGAETKRGDLLPPDVRLKDQMEIIKGGVTMIGPQYELNDMSFEVAKANNVKIIYTVRVDIDGVPMDRKYIWALNAKNPLPEEKLRAAVAAKVKAVAGHKEIAWWDIGAEELRFWKKYEVDILRIMAETIRANDPLKRPVVMYEPGHRGAQSMAKLLPFQDLSFKGMYVTYYGMKKQRVWARWSTEQQVEGAKLAGKPQIPAICLPSMFKQPEPADIPLIPAWVRHDVYTALASGAKGVVVFSASKRPNFTARQAYLDEYLKVCRQLTGPLGLGQVFLFGQRMDDLELAVVEGPQTTTLVKDKIKKDYPSVNFANIAYNHERYIVLVNDTATPVKAIVSGLPYGTETVAKDLLDDKSHETSAPEGDLEAELGPWGVSVYRVRRK